MNKKSLIRYLSVVLAILMSISLFPISASDPDVQDQDENEIPTIVEPSFDSDAKSLILIEASSGRVLYENNADEPLPPASVTKIMTLLLVMEAVDNGQIKLSDPVTVSEAAAAMGGSQVYLKVGEQLSVEEMIKCVVIASANDAALALAELIAGSEESFVSLMNKRAKELGMKNTNFENTNGLDDTTVNHVISARDIAIMSAELMKHTVILKYTTIWQDSIRNGAFVLTNTNRLIRFYPGANGLKTGSTGKAGFCISAAAKREGMQLIAVVMGSSTRDSRNETAKQMLNWGFSNFTRITVNNTEALSVPINYGKQNCIKASYGTINLVIEKKFADNIEKQIVLKESVDAPIKKGESVGKMICSVNGTVMCETPIYTVESVDKNTFGSLFVNIVKKYFLI